MSREKPEDFKPSFYEAIKLALEDGECKIECDLQSARNYRSSFYHFRRVLKEHNHELYPSAAKCKFSVDGSGLTIRPKGQDIQEKIYAPSRLHS